MTLVLLLFNGLVWGLIVSLMSVGLNLIYGVLGVINVAHGAFYMLGAVLGWFIAQQTGFWVAVLLAPLLVALFGVVVERFSLRPLLNQPVMTILATFAWMLMIQQAVILSPFGPTIQRLEAPFRHTLWVAGVPYSGYRLLVALLAVLVIALVWIFLRYTRYGLWVRAVRQNPELALGLGIPVPWVYSLTFGLGTGVAALAGVLTGPLGAVHALMGVDLLILAFLVVIVGGSGHLGGAVLVALLARMGEGAFTLWMQPTEAKLLTLVLLGLLVLLKPSGLFGSSA